MIFASIIYKTSTVCLTLTTTMNFRVFYCHNEFWVNESVLLFWSPQDGATHLSNTAARAAALEQHT